MARVYSPGKYNAKIIDWTLGETKKGDCQIVWRVSILSKENGDEAPVGDRSIYRVVTANTVDWVDRELQHLGYDSSQIGLDGLNKDHKDAFDFGDIEVTVELKYEDYTDKNGKKKEAERWSLVTGAAPVKQAERATVAKANALFAAHKRASGGKTPVRTAPAIPPRPTRQSQPIVDNNGEEIF